MTREDMARCCEDVAVGAVLEDVNAALVAAAAELRKRCDNCRYSAIQPPQFRPEIGLLGAV